MAVLNHGRPFHVDDLPRLGLSRHALRALLRDGAVRRELRSVYVDAHTEDARDLRLACLALVMPPGAVVCSETAAWLHGLDVFAPGRRFDHEPEIVVHHASGRVRRPGVSCRQALFAPGDVVRLGGLLVTTPLRTTSDLLRRTYRPYALAAADAFARAGLVDRAALEEYVGRLKGYRGIVQARSLAALVHPGAQSAGESWTRLRCHDAGFPPLEPQVEVVGEHGRRFFLDLADRRRRIAVEYDGREHHTSVADRLWDADRREHLSRVHGWRFVVVGRSGIFGDDTSFEHELGMLFGVRPLDRTWGTRPERQQ